MSENDQPKDRPPVRPAGSVVPWPLQRHEMPEMTGDEALVEKTWTEIDAWAYAFAWHCVVSF